jgi:hypothetical protein
MAPGALAPVETHKTPCRRSKHEVEIGKRCAKLHLNKQTRRTYMSLACLLDTLIFCGPVGRCAPADYDLGARQSIDQTSALWVSAGEILLDPYLYHTV